MKEKILKLLPAYSVVPIALVCVANVMSYQGARIFLGATSYHDLSTVIDDYIPFLPIFIIPYVLAYIQWGLGYVMIGRDSKRLCYKYCFGDVFAKVICFVIFVMYPSNILRPEIVGSGVLEQLTTFIYAMDEPNNLFPSIHCLESYICYRAACEMNRENSWHKWYKLAMGIMSILVFASTVLIKQHVFVDIIGGIVVAEIGIFISKRILKGKNNG